MSTNSQHSQSSFTVINSQQAINNNNNNDNPQYMDHTLGRSGRSTTTTASPRPPPPTPSAPVPGSHTSQERAQWTSIQAGFFLHSPISAQCWHCWWLCLLTHTLWHCLQASWQFFPIHSGFRSHSPSSAHFSHSASSAWTLLHISEGVQLGIEILIRRSQSCSQIIEPRVRAFSGGEDF